jgi:hypothetical protein
MPPEAEESVAEESVAEESVDGPIADAPVEDAPTEDAVLLFVGGPLDGRVEIRAARHGEPLPTVTHVHLHDGPKVVHRYDLQPLAEQAGIYTVRPPENPDRTDRD